MKIKGQRRSLELPQFVRLAATDAVSELGPLAGLVGTWTGSQGWNLIAVPTPGSSPEGFTLLIRPYYETITFTPLGVMVPDRGASEILNIYGLEYSLKVSDLVTNEPLHLENGMWLYMEDPQDPSAPTVVRQAAIPHGNSVLALGNSQQAGGPPTIPELNAFPVGNPTNPPSFGYTDPYLHPDLPSLPGLPPFSASDANNALRESIAGQTILSTLTLSVSTQPPSGGGGIVNIPFIQKNANAVSFDATFWIEKVKSEAGEFDQLQYSQQTNLQFIQCASECGEGWGGLIVWPHVNVNTLVRQ